MKRLAILCVVLAVAALPGCKRGGGIKDEKTFDLEPTAPHALYIPACKKFEVTFTTKDNVPVNAYVMSQKDGEASIEASAVKGTKMAFKENVFNDKVGVSMKDKAEYAVVFVSNKRTTVTAKITGE